MTAQTTTTGPVRWLSKAMERRRQQQAQHRQFVYQPERVLTRNGQFIKAAFESRSGEVEAGGIGVFSADRDGEVVGCILWEVEGQPLRVSRVLSPADMRDLAHMLLVGADHIEAATATEGRPA